MKARIISPDTPISIATGKNFDKADFTTIKRVHRTILLGFDDTVDTVSIKTQQPSLIVEPDEISFDEPYQITYSLIVSRYNFIKMLIKGVNPGSLLETDITKLPIEDLFEALAVCIHKWETEFLKYGDKESTLVKILRQYPISISLAWASANPEEFVTPLSRFISILGDDSTNINEESSNVDKVINSILNNIISNQTDVSLPTTKDIQLEYKKQLFEKYKTEDLLNLNLLKMLNIITERIN